MPTSTDVRTTLVGALQADLVGPFSQVDGAAEELTIAPSRWYLTGFLAPKADRETKDPTADEEFGTGTDDEDENEVAPEPEPKQKNAFPASLGMSVLLPAPAGGDDIVKATVSFAEYIREERETPERKKKRTVWRRVPQPPRSVELRLEANAIEKGAALPDTPNVRVCGKLEPADAPGLDPGTRALSLFVVNERTPGERGRQDEQFMFQVRMELAFEPGFVPRPNRLGEGSEHPDDDTADLQFRDHREWAVGHGVAVEIPDEREKVTLVRTTWIPSCEVRNVDTHEEPKVVTSMEDLAALSDGAALEKALSPIIDAYGAWIESQGSIPLDSDDRKIAANVF